MNDQSAAGSGRRVVGKINDFDSFPASITIDRDPYFIVRHAGAEGEEPTYKLISAICPHAGGVVRPMHNELICPLHYWCFDIETGESTNVPGEQLDCQPLDLIDGEFVVGA